MDRMEPRSTDQSSRGAFVRGALALGAGAVLAGAATTGAPEARADDQALTCADSARTVLDTALTLERLMVTFYYKALTSRGVMRDSQLAGPSANPNNPGLPPGGHPSNVRYLQAALDAEVKHAAMLTREGARSPYTRFYFPDTTFRSLGNAHRGGSFLGLLDLLERLSETLYVTAATQLLRLRQDRLATLATDILGVESEHCALGRVIGQVGPANDLTLRGEPFSCMSDAQRALNPFLTGKRFLFASDVRTATPLPTSAQTKRVIGKHGTVLVSSYLLRSGKR